MRKLFLILALLSPILLSAQTPARFDLPVLTTTPSTTPPGDQPPLYAVINATVNVCGYPATMSGGVCTNKVTTYTDSTLSTACSPTAQLTAPGTSVCISTTGLQGALGFWYDSSQQTHMTYTISTKWGNFGPYDILPGGAALGCTTDCVVTDPSGSQNITQPDGTALTLNTKNFCLQDGTDCPFSSAGSLVNPQCFLGGGGLTGAFTDGSGNVIQPLCIGNGPASYMVPTGATQLQLGINDSNLADNTGSFTASVTYSGTITNFTVPATAQPWVSSSNPSYSYGNNTGTAPIVVQTGLTGGSTIVVAWVSGSVNWGGGEIAPNGNGTGAVLTGTGSFGGKGFYPTKYMTAAAYVGSGTTSNALTAAATGGAAPGTTFNGSAAVTLDYHSLGAQQALTLTTTGTSGPATLTGGALNIPQYTGGGGGSPGGSTGAIQYNNAGAFGGANLTGVLYGNGSSAPTVATTQQVGSALFDVNGNSSISSGTPAMGWPLPATNIGNLLWGFGAGANLGNFTPITTTGTASSGSTTLTVASATGIVVPMNISGAGIASGTTVAGISGTTITLSAATTAALSSTPVSFTPGNTADLIAIGNNACLHCESNSSSVVIGQSNSFNDIGNGTGGEDQNMVSIGPFANYNDNGSLCAYGPTFEPVIIGNKAYGNGCGAVQSQIIGNHIYQLTGASFSTFLGASIADDMAANVWIVPSGTIAIGAQIFNPLRSTFVPPAGTYNVGATNIVGQGSGGARL